jgi:CRP-like cAMP-binding protein
MRIPTFPRFWLSVAHEFIQFHYMSDILKRPELPAFGIVAELELQDRALLGNYGEFLPAQPGEILIKAGEAQEHLYLVISGLLHVTIMVEGRTKLVARIVAGETLGEVNVFDPGKASATVTAQDFTQIWRANRDDIDLFVKAYPEAGSILLGGVISVMCRRIRNMNDKLADIQSMENLAKFW